MLILSTSKEDIKVAANLIKSGRLVAFPTETVYGVGCIYNNEKAYNALNELKRRKPNKPYTLMLSDINDISKYAYVNDKIIKFLSKFMPGEITVILKAKKLPEHIMNNESTIGIRIPKCETTLELLKEVSTPLLVPSLNRSGETPMNDIKDIKDEFNEELDAIIKSDITSNIPSTVISLCDNIKVLREGKIPSNELIEEFNKL